MGAQVLLHILSTGHHEWAGEEWREHIHDLNDRETGREVDEEEDKDIGSSSEKDSQQHQPEMKAPHR